LNKKSVFTSVSSSPPSQFIIVARAIDVSVGGKLRVREDSIQFSKGRLLEWTITRNSKRLSKGTETFTFLDLGGAISWATSKRSRKIPPPLNYRTPGFTTE